MIAKLNETLENLDMHEEICGHMHALLYESPSLHEVEELERPPCRTPVPPPLRHEEEDDEIIMIHEDSHQ